MWEGIDKRPDYLSESIKNLFAIWGRPVNLATVMDGEGQLYRFDGKEITVIKSEIDNSKEESTEGGDPKSKLPSGGGSSQTP